VLTNSLRAHEEAARKPQPAANSPTTPAKPDEQKQNNQKKKRGGEKKEKKRGKGRGQTGGASLLPRASPYPAHKSTGMDVSASRVGDKCNESLFDQQGSVDCAVPDRVDRAVQAVNG
jgi:hypothetical protein